MNIYLKNIGIVKESNILLNGLTVIAGKNNSGKTTVGKTLFSLIEAVSNLKEKIASDRKNYIARQLENVDSELELLFLYLHPYFRELEKHGAQKNSLYHLFSDLTITKNESIELHAKRLYAKLRNFDCEDIEITPDIKRYFNIYSRLEATKQDEFIPLLKKRIENAIAILENTFHVLEQDPESVQYVKTSIEQTLLSEFNGQIQPVRNPQTRSEIGLTDDGDLCFSMEIEENRIANNKGERIFYSSPCKKAFLIDDPFALDDSIYAVGKRNRTRNFEEIGSVFNKKRLLSHGAKLQRTLHSKVKPTILEMTILEETLKPVREKIEAVLPGRIEFSSEGTYYVQEGIKLQASNLATGSKMFSIIKLLLEMGELDNSTMLILDEPEAHLHPMWQNIFAEIIALLVKEVGVRILLTTHSPNFMLAIDAYMRKYGLADKTNFYQTVETKDGFVNYQCVNDNLELIYGDFFEYLSEVKALRDSYLFS